MSKRLARWYAANARALPWRLRQDPYAIWLSEIILQQTRVAQGLPYYEHFITRYPTVRHLAEAPLDGVLKSWEGLGYYSRARNMHRAASIVWNDYAGQFPKDYAGLLTLPGVGAYTAAAMSSICYGEARAVVDGNVVRVISRLARIPHRNEKAAEKRIYQQIADALLDPKNPGDHNQAMMELGARICTPQPSCTSCPLKRYCAAFLEDDPIHYPPPKKAIKKRSRSFHYLWLQQSAERYVIRQRAQGDIWAGLYECPMIEADQRPRRDRWVDLLGPALALRGRIRSIAAPSQQILTHQHIHAEWYTTDFQIDGPLAEQIGDFIIVDRVDLQNFAFPRLLTRFIQEQGLY